MERKIGICSCGEKNKNRHRNYKEEMDPKPIFYHLKYNMEEDLSRFKIVYVGWWRIQDVG